MQLTTPSAWRSLLPWIVAAGIAGCSPRQDLGPPPDPLENPPAPRTSTEQPTMSDLTHEVRVVARDMRFHPDHITVRPGQPVQVTLVNEGDAPHSIEFELPGGEKELEVSLPPGQEQTLRFEAPSQTGDYTFYCPVANHRERGMTGTLTVAGAS